ncbi:MAG TPA: hypothetical protein VMI35_13010 [Puia sp.]|nr:hypothetical protein [Puia sp.]
MKTIKSLLCVAALYCTAAQAPAQKTNLQTGGLYASLNDFEQQKLTYPIDCNSGSDKLKVNDLFGSATGYVIHQGEKKSFSKSAVYGYRTCSNKNYRFYRNEAFQILGSAGFYLYYQYKSVEQTKGKGLVKTDLYYFSVRGSDDLHPLSIENLKNAFADNAAFCDAIDNNFGRDSELLKYDSPRKMYKLQYLYQQTLKQP